MAQRKKINKIVTKCFAALLTGVVLLSGCGAEKVTEVDVETLEKGSANTGGSLHDPFIIQGEDGTFYCYGSHMTAAKSDDLIKWKSWANGVTKNNKIYDNLLIEPFDAFSYVGKGEQGDYSVWAPSIIYNVYHQRYLNRNEEHAVRVHRMAMNKDGWPCIFPFQTAGEELSADGYTEDTVRGVYYVVDHGLKVDASVNEPVKCTFAGGKISGDLEGTYTLEESTNYIDIKVGDTEFKGVLVDMPDEAGNPTRCFTAVGNNNHSLWGVQYLEGEE